jgi:hypothetical protein
MRFDNPPLSFKPKHLFIRKEDDLKYIISADGIHVGWLITRNGYDCDIVPDNQPMIQEDKDYIIAEFLKLKNNRRRS